MLCSTNAKTCYRGLVRYVYAGKTRRFNEIKAFIDRFNLSEPADKTFVQNALIFENKLAFDAKEIDPENPDANGPIHVQTVSYPRRKKSLPLRS